MAFDQNKYKKIFEARNGAGSFDSALSSAREAGKLKTMASIQKQLFMEEFKKRKKAQEEYDLYGQSKESWEAQNKATGKITSQQEKAQDQGRGGHLPTRENQKTERAKTEKATKAREKKYAKGFLTEEELSEMTPYARQQYLGEQNKKEQEEKSKTVGGKLKNFFTSKDTDGDGRRDGLLGALEIIDRPGDAVRTGIKEKLEGGSFLEGLKDGFTGKKDTYGTDLNKALGFNPDEDKKDKVISRVIGDQAIGKLPLGEFIAPFVNKDTKEKVGKETTGVASEVVTDPLNLIGTGLITGGIRKAGSLAKNVAKGANAADEVLGLPAPKPEPLGLPEPQIKLPEPKPLVPDLKRPTGLNNPIPQIPDVMRQPLAQARLESKGLGFGIGSKYEPKASNRMMFPESTQNQAYWQKRYEDFVQHVNSSYDMNRMTPEALEDIWTQFARYDEPVTLDQVVDLAYPKGFEAPAAPKQVAPEPVPVQEPPSRTIKDNLAADPRINELVKGLFPPQKPISRVATPDEVIKMMQEGVASQKKAPQDILRPLQFSREKYVMTNRKPLKTPNNEVAATTENIKPGRDYESISPKGNSITKPQDEHGYGLIDLEAEAKAKNAVSEKAMQEIEDISSFQVGTKNLYEIADRLPKAQGNHLKKSLDTAKKNMVADTERVTSDLMEKVVKGLGIKKGSKESALVQDFGEKTLVKKYLRKRGIDPSKLSKEELNRINLQQLKKVHPDSWQKIVAADNYFREKYNARIDEINAVRAKIYPNQPDKIVPRRDDYYHHFNELEGMEGIKNLFDTPANIDPHLEGVSANTKPKTKFQGFMQKRGLGPYKSDAVGGYLKYAQASSHSINVDPVIPVIRNIKNQIADATVDTRNANKIVEALDDHANDLAGKTNPWLDRVVQKGLNRKGFKIMNWANSRVKSNMILGNLGSALGQIGSVPLGIGKAKTSALPGLIDTLDQSAKAILKAEKNAPVYQSDFLKERFSDKMYRQFDQRLIDQPRNMAVWMLETADKAGTKFIWNSMYRKGLKEKVADPIKYADYEARKLVAGRGVGEVPLLQKSKTVQVLAPFTLEVGNQWKVLRDMVGEKDAAGIITFLVASYGLNRAIEEVRGMGVSFDPIDAILDGYTEEDGGIGAKSINALASLTGEVVGNIPGGNLLTQFANTEKEVPLTDVKFKELFGERNPNRFGTGLTIAKPLSDPLYLMPFGAAQIRKTQKGIDAIRNEGVYKDGDGKELMYPVESGIAKNAQMLMFGPSSTSEAKEYYNQERKSLSERQTNEYKTAEKNGAGKEYYENLMKTRRMDTIQKEISKVEKNPELSIQERREEILRLMAELRKLQK